MEDGELEKKKNEIYLDGCRESTGIFGRRYLKLIDVRLT